MLGPALHPVAGGQYLPRNPAEAGYIDIQRLAPDQRHFGRGEERLPDRWWEVVAVPGRREARAAGRCRVGHGRSKRGARRAGRGRCRCRGGSAGRRAGPSRRRACRGGRGSRPRPVSGARRSHPCTARRPRRAPNQARARRVAPAGSEAAGAGQPGAEPGAREAGRAERTGAAGAGEPGVDAGPDAGPGRPPRGRRTVSRLRSAAGRPSRGGGRGSAGGRFRGRRPTPVSGTAPRRSRSSPRPSHAVRRWRAHDVRRYQRFARAARDPGAAGRDGVSAARRPAGRGRSRRLEAGNGHVARACRRARGWPCRRARGWPWHRTCRWLCRRARRWPPAAPVDGPAAAPVAGHAAAADRPAGRRPGEAAGQARDHRSTRSSGLAYWSGMCAASVSGPWASRRRDRRTRWRGGRAALIAAGRTGRGDRLGRAGPACARRRMGRTHPRSDPRPMRRMCRR